jgi:hypothetical protein
VDFSPFSCSLARDYLCIYLPPLLGAWLNGAYQGFIICFLKKDLLMITTSTPQKRPLHSLNPDQRLNGRKKNPKYVLKQSPLSPEKPEEN